MSGLVKSAKKLFKKAVHVVKKYWKVVAIAALAYFTFGVALSYLPATSTFAASLPGFAGGGFAGLGVGAGATAGTGVFSTIATGLGVGGGLAAGAAGVSTAGAAVGASAAAAAGGGSAAAGAAAAGTAAGGAAGATGAAAAAGGLSFVDKLLLAKTGVDLVAGLTAPKPPDEAALIRESKNFQGAFYGVERDGSGAPAPAQQGKPSSQAPAPAAAPAQAPGRQLATPAPPGQQPAPPGTPMPVSNFRPPEQTQRPQQAAAQQVTNQGQNRDLFAQRAPGVRYLA